MKLMNKNTKAGFTLVELIVVIAILGILAGIAVPTYSGYIKKANEAADNMLLSAVNTAFGAASVDAGQYDGKPASATATLTDGAVTQVKSSVDTDGSIFAKYFAGNENNKFRVFTNLAYNRATGNFKGATVTTATVDGVKTHSYNIDGVTYNVTQDQLDAVNNSTFGTNMTMDELAGDVSGMVDALNSALGGGALLANVLENSGMDLAAMGINSSDENYTSELANAAVLLVAKSTTADTATNLVNALSTGNINSLMSVETSYPSSMGTLLSNMGALYGIATGFSKSDAAADWSITVGENTYNAAQYYDYVNSQIVAAAQSTDNKMNNIMNALGLLSAYVYNDPTDTSKGITTSFTKYKTVAEGSSTSQLQDDANGYVNAMAAIASNSDSLVSSGALQSGFDSGDIGAILNMIFGG